jgi:thiol:disulfide interchange protein
MRRFISFLGRFFPILTILFFAVCVQASDDVTDNSAVAAHTRVMLLSSTANVQPGQSFWVGLKMEMESGWHVYWRNPGDSGFPVSIQWKLPEGFHAEEILWPIPESFEEAQMVTYGYADEVLFLSRVSAPVEAFPEDGWLIGAKIDFLACKVICVPGVVRLEKKFPLDQEEIILSEKEISYWLDHVPIAEAGWDIEAFREDRVLVLSGEVQGNNTLPSRLSFYPYDPDLIDHAGKQEVSFSKDSSKLRIPLSVADHKQINSISGVLVADQPWFDGESNLGWAILELPVSEKAQLTAGIQVPAQTMGVWAALLFAFFGGIILNLMPCVLPVLSLKILNFVKQSGESRYEIFQHGLFFSIGIISAFWALAGILIMLRLVGFGVGWGFQFQSPSFLAFMIFLFLLITLNLFGVFDVGSGLGGIAQQGSPRRSGLRGSYWNGVLATVVATPCTAPFMGAALGFALSQPIWVAWLIFSALGLGMALPYLALSMNPGWMRWIPKPGLWMVSLKQSFGFFMLGTLCWLMWVLGVQLGVEGVITMLFACVGFSFGVWLWGRPGGGIQKKIRRNKLIAAMILVIILGFVGFSIGRIPVGLGRSEQGATGWETFSPALVEDYRTQKLPVFINFTASWCLSCQVNNSTTLGRQEVLDAFAAKGVKMIKADWTNYDPVITDALGAMGKSSIPVYVLYPVGAQDPLILPELLTPGIVYDYLEDI